MPGLRKTIEQIVCDYELYAINKNCLFDIIPPKCIIFFLANTSSFSPTAHILMPGIIRIIVSVQYPSQLQIIFSAAGMAALPRAGWRKETLEA